VENRPDGESNLELTTIGIAPDGDAFARDPKGRPIFVRGAIPGEKVRVELLVDRRQSAKACVVEVIDPSPHRILPACPEVSRGCGACTWQHIDISKQEELKVEMVENALRREGVVHPTPTHMRLAPWHFRTTIRATVKDGRAGFFRSRSHDMVPVGTCMIAHPLLHDLLVDNRYPGAREVLLRCGARTKERLVAIKPSDISADLADDVLADHFHERAAGRLWRISATSFFQARPDGADVLAHLVGAAAAELGSPSTAIDLYSGVGLFAGALASRGWEVTAVEGSYSAVEDAKVNLDDLPVSIVRDDVTRWIPGRGDFVVADPSRQGLGPQGVQVVVGTGARRIVLVSCDAASFARDAAQLQRSVYTMTAMTYVDLFPHTFRIEIVSVFDRIPYSNSGIQPP
jgi:23S rRNA (uracil1939-C5)-methyltransferase